MISAAALAASDARQARIGALHAEVLRALEECTRADPGSGNDARACGEDEGEGRSCACVRLVEERLRLMELEGMLPLAWDTQWAASQAAALLRNTAEAVRWAASAAECARLAQGHRGEDFLLYRKPSGRRK